MKINVLVHGNASVLAQLSQEPLRPLCGELLVEAATAPNLGLALALETPVSFPGLAGLPHPEIDLEALAVKHDRLPVPIVLAPGKQISPRALVSAVAHLADGGPQPAEAGVLLHLEDALEAPSLLGFASTVAIAWDMADPCGEALPKLAELLAAEGLLTPETFRGFVPYVAEGRQYDPADVNAMAGLFSAVSA